jgi:hypothetical protein
VRFVTAPQFASRISAIIPKPAAFASLQAGKNSSFSFHESGISPSNQTTILTGEVLAMRVMVIVKATKASESGAMPDEKLLTAMGKFNQQLLEAGVMLAGEGLQPTSKGVRVKFSGSQRTVVNGPFPEPQEQIAGFWLWKVSSMDEAIDWVRRCPNPHSGDSEIEIRPLYEAEDFSAASPELVKQEKRMREQIANRQ